MSLQQVKGKENFKEKNYFLLSSWKPLKRRAGSGSRTVIQCSGSAVLDSKQYVTDPVYCFLFNNFSNYRSIASLLTWRYSVGLSSAVKCSPECWSNRPNFNLDWDSEAGLETEIQIIFFQIRATIFLQCNKGSGGSYRIWNRGKWGLA